VRYKRRSHRDYEDDEESIGDDLAAINDRLDELTRHLEGLARSNSRRAAAPRERDRDRDREQDENSPDRVGEALARLDRRLDQVIAEARSAPIEAQRRLQQAMPLPAPPPPPPPPPPAPAAPNWAAEISARQRALDGGGATARAIPQPHPQPQPQAQAQAWAPAPAPSQDLSTLEHQLRHITAQIATLHQPYEDALTALRSDLAEVGRTLKEAMPRHAVEALENEIRELSERVSRSRQAGGDPAALTNLERGLAEVRDALRNLAPAENLIGFEDAVRGLSYKIDQLSANAGGPGPDPAVFAQLDEAIAAMRHIGSHVASDGALAQLAAEVHGLANRFEQASHEQHVGSNETLSRLESRISALMESGRSLPPDLEAVIHSVNDRLDRMQLTQGDQLALGGLEDRIVKLVERLDSYDSKLSNLDTIQRGMTDVLVQLEEMRKAGATRPSRATPALVEPAAATELMPPAPQLASAAVAAPPAVIARPAEPEVFVPQAPRPPTPPKAAPPPPRAERRPIEPNLPPDTPLEPGSGVPRSKPGSAAARIAASEAALGGVRPPMSETGGKSAAIAAARNAAMSYQPDGTDEDAPKRSLFSFFKSRKPKLPKPPKPPKAAKMPKPPKPANLADPDAAMPTMRQRVIKQVKTLVIAVSVVIIVLGTLQTAMDYFMAPAEAPGGQSLPAESRAPDVQPPVQAPASMPARPPGRAMPTPDSLPPTEPMPDPDSTQSINRSMFDPTTVLAPKQQPAANADITGSIGNPTPAQRQPQPATADPVVNALPPAFGPVLRAAAASGDHSAQYEIGHRYSEGSGVPRNVEEGIRWFDRAANAGFVPAQFRLAGIYEKGAGVKKDLNRARKLYLAAAEKGHAKAMHNLAVLFAEGVDGKPDYRAAAHWFRKAAAHGVADSQFNLAVLYARGIGVEQNLAESYKWFALAAGAGDQDAARKRDEVATRLDQQSIMAARLAAQTFTPEREPDEAINVKSPPGGWDRTATAVQPAKPKPRPRAAGTP